MELPDVAAATIRELLENSMEPLFNALHPGCKKNGKFSNISVIRPSISRAVAPLFAIMAMVFSGLNKAYHTKKAHADMDLPDCLHANTILNLCF